MKENFLVVGNCGLFTTEFDGLLASGENEKAEQWLISQNWYAYSSDLTIIRRFWLENFGKLPNIKPRFIISDFNSILKGISYGQGISIVAYYLAPDLIEKQELKKIWKGANPSINTMYLA